MSERIYSIDFVGHDGVTWTATVGEQLHGLKEPRRTRRPRSLTAPLPRPTKVGDRATVLAIFRSQTFIVVTNHLIGGNSVGSAFVNPFLAGEPIRVTRFG